MSDLAKLALKLGTSGPHKTLPTDRQIRILFGGSYIVKTTRAVFVWEHPFYPQLYIPAAEFHPSTDGLQISLGEEFATPEGVVVATRWTLTAGAKSSDQALAFATKLAAPAAQPLQGLVKVDFASMDGWFEEDTPMFVHPKDPFRRVDILASTRALVVRVGGQVVARAASAMHLFETGLPTRYYLPLTSVDPAVLRPSATRTSCPYKGEAEYYSVAVGGQVWEDVVWFYRAPLLESARVEGLCCFYNEKVEIELDGVVLDRPVTHFSRAGPNVAPSAV